MVQRTKGRHGGVYYYFFCGGRQDDTCDQPYIPVELMEELVIAHYAKAVWLPGSFRTEVRTQVDAASETGYSLSGEVRDQLNHQLAKLDKKESYFLDLGAEEDWPKDKLRQKIQSIRTEQRSIRRELEQTERQLETGSQVFYRALELLDDPQAAYAAGSEVVRSILNKAFFTRLYIDVRPEGRQVVGHELKEPFDLLEATYGYYETQTRPATLLSLALAEMPETTRAAVPDRYSGSDVQSPLTEALALALRVRGSSTAVMVELRGLEPLTPTLPVWFGQCL